MGEGDKTFVDLVSEVWKIEEETRHLVQKLEEIMWKMKDVLDRVLYLLRKYTPTVKGRYTMRLLSRRSEGIVEVYIYECREVSVHHEAHGVDVRYVVFKCDQLDTMIIHMDSVRTDDYMFLLMNMRLVVDLLRVIKHRVGRIRTILKEVVEMAEKDEKQLREMTSKTVTESHTRLEA